MKSLSCIILGSLQHVCVMVINVLPFHTKQKAFLNKYKKNPIINISHLIYLFIFYLRLANIYINILLLYVSLIILGGLYVSIVTLLFC